MQVQPPLLKQSMRPSTRPARILGFVGATGGIFAVMLVLPYQIKSFYPDATYFTTAIFENRSVMFMTFMLLAFLTAGFLTMLTLVIKNAKWLAIMITVAGIVLLTMSALTIASVGGYAFYPAICVLASGILFLRSTA